MIVTTKVPITLHNSAFWINGDKTGVVHIPSGTEVKVVQELDWVFVVEYEGKRCWVSKRDVIDGQRNYDLQADNGGNK